ncbi:MAG: hypothetical protein A2W47_04615 [Gammaproteobacteria bacterium RIFCSPHIGHO2_12_38_15]|nr:MAG: hypothetical protein A2W47_04615 [Gammaproteobacteria bacterium RIFCSPHIGHO2_12_38_15]
MRENNEKLKLKSASLDTQLGPMLAISDEKTLYFLTFIERNSLNNEIERGCQKTKAEIVSGHTKVTYAIEKELNLYFEGKLKAFKTSLFLVGTFFQKKVWEALKKIPYGETISYAAIAKEIGNPTAFRAVAQAAAANPVAIVIPCHRMITSGGKLGGYAGGVERKRYLINHEKSDGQA